MVLCRGVPFLNKTKMNVPFFSFFFGPTHRTMLFTRRRRRRESAGNICSRLRRFFIPYFYCVTRELVFDIVLSFFDVFFNARLTSSGPQGMHGPW